MGIGARITAIFGLGALLLSISMGGLAYFTTRHFLLAERESAAQTQTFANAYSVLTYVVQGHKSFPKLLTQLDSASNSRSLLIHGAKTYTSSAASGAINESSIPAKLRTQILDGNTATQTYISGPKGQPEIVVGLPIPSIQADYFEVFSLSDLGHTLRVLALTLVGTGIVTTLLGITLGRFARHRSLRPLTDVSQAAVAIARGRLDTRLETDAADPDLEGLTSSFNTMVDQLQARIQREARFNSDVSHELRSPLTTLSASLEVLETDRDNLPPRAQRALQLLGDDLRRFQRMVGDLLEMSRADAGSADVFLEEVNVSELVERAVQNGLRSLGETASTPSLRIGPNVESLHVGVDKRRFERVMANLLENAANYGGGATVISVTTDEPERPEEEAPIGGARIGLSGGIRHVGRNGSGGARHAGGIGARHGSRHGNGSVNGSGGHGGTIGPDRGSGAPVGSSVGDPGPGNGRRDGRAMVQIGVEDAGPGISAAERAKVFDRFYRGSAAGRRGTGTGTGLGLALVAEHLRLMNGEAWVESSPSGGARFVISLPVLEPDEGPTW